MDYYIERILYYVASFLAVAVVLTFHEFAHAFVAHKCGDDTARMEGRMTLNPLKHFDLLGLVMFTLVGFGWAKPVPINPYNFKKERRDLVLVSSAGIIMNYIMAFVFWPLYLLFIKYVVASYGNVLIVILVENFLYCVVAYSLGFCVFNLLPFYPLDGFRIVDGMCRRDNKVLRFLRRYGYGILLGLIVESFLCRFLADYVYFFGYLDILGYVLSFAQGILGWPITAFWGLII